MKKLMISLILVWLGLGISTISAANNNIRSEYQLMPQYPWAKSFKVKLFLYPTSDVQKIEVRWSPSDIVTVVPDSKVVRATAKESPYALTFKIVPRRKGQILLHASIVYYSGVSTYVDSIDIPLEFDAYLHLPPGPNHTLYLVVFYLVVFVFSLIVVYGVYKLANFIIYDYIPKWLARKTSQPI